MNKLSALLISSLLCLANNTTTGYSHCRIEIVPIATGANRTVLFKTFFSINPHGAHLYEPVELGWLVVSADGVWEYVTHMRLDFQEGNFVSAADSVHLKSFKDRFNIRHPPKTVEKLMKKYDIKRSIRSDRGKGLLVRHADGIYKGGKRMHLNHLKTLDNIVSQPSSSDTPIKCTFYHDGVAVFRSRKGFDEDDNEILEGATFLSGAVYDGEQVWIDLYEIDAIVIIPD
jgi:hypothetical protein